MLCIIIIFIIIVWILKVNSFSFTLGALSYSSAFFGQGTGPIQIDNVECSGSERALVQCTHLTIDNCVHAEDAGVRCGPPGACQITIIIAVVQWCALFNTYCCGVVHLAFKIICFPIMPCRQLYRGWLETSWRNDFWWRKDWSLPWGTMGDCVWWHLEYS